MKTEGKVEGERGREEWSEDEQEGVFTGIGGISAGRCGTTVDLVKCIRCSTSTLRGTNTINFKPPPSFNAHCYQQNQTIKSLLTANVIMDSDTIVDSYKKLHDLPNDPVVPTAVIFEEPVATTTVRTRILL